MTFGEVRFQLSKRAPGTDPDLLDGFINEAYRSILARTSWKLLETDATFVTVPTYTTGMLSLVTGSTAVVGIGTAFTAGMAGMGLAIPPSGSPYLFTYVDATHGTLDRPFEGTTNATAGFTLYKDIYPLPADYARPFVALNQRRAGLIGHMDRKQLDRSAPTRVFFGEPAVYSIVSATAGIPNAQLYPIPAYAASYPFTYIQKQPYLGEADTNTEFLPWVSDKAILDLTRAAIEADRKNYTGAAAYTAAAAPEIQMMLAADAKVRGPQQIRMAPFFTRHRLERTARYGRTHFR